MPPILMRQVTDEVVVAETIATGTIMEGST
jgi:hypothetical protein